MAAAVAKAGNLEPLWTHPGRCAPHATVIGGGVAGLRGALELSRRGIAVTLVEKTPFLGGQVAKLDRLVPTGETAEAVIRQLSEAALSNPRSRSAPVPRSALRGICGQFQADLKPASARARGMQRRWAG